MELVLLGMENQEHIHYAMPMRIMGYDYGAYKKQYDSNAKKYKTAKGLSEDEFLSRMKKDDKFVPVITVVIYYGEKPWDGPKKLHDMLDIPKEIAKYVNDYKMLLVEARENNLLLHNMNNQDLFNLLGILLDKERPSKETREKAIEYTREHEVDKNVVMTVAGAANCKLDYNALAWKGDADMCTVFEETRMEGILEGKIQGKIEGKIEGKAEGKIEGKIEAIIKMLRKYKESDEKIISELMEELEISVIEAKDYLEKYNKGLL